jgi:hypothetical protein
MKLKLSLLLLIVIQISYAQQRTCGMEQKMQQIMNDPAAKQQYLQLQAMFEVELQKLSASNKNGNVTNDVQIIRIPVAVHYPTAGAATEAVKSCLRALAQNQINILNADYNATNADIANFTGNDTDFYPGVSVGNLGVQFELATLNHPAGTGLVDGQVAVTFGTDFLASGNPNCSNGCNDDATWSGYMNLVVKNLAGGLLGFSPLGGFPGVGESVLIDNNSFSSIMSGNPASCSGFVPEVPFNLGRTLTHELGHFFNLDHTFNNGTCSTSTNCNTQGDRICDTPQVAGESYGCPVAGEVGSCTFEQFALTMNYMDYVDDACMYMFTLGQENRMRAHYNAIASQFSASALANNEVWANSFSIYPNPSKGSFNIEFKEMTNNYAVEVFDIAGQVIYDNRFDISSMVQTINLDNTGSGIYFVNIKSDNGLMVTKKLVIE